jgi:Phosphotransferase enzyme family
MTSANSLIPTPADAERIAARACGSLAIRAERFSTGLANHVYDVLLKDGRQVVVRIVSPNSDTNIAAAVYWSKQLRPLGVPLPELIAYDEHGEQDGFPWMILQRFRGVDLSHAYSRMRLWQKQYIAEKVVAAQRIVAKGIACGEGFGFVVFPTKWPCQSWDEVVRGSLDLARERILKVGVVDVGWVDRVQRLSVQFEAYFRSIEPTPFLDDTTTKNVIIDDHGNLSGIVDVDSICYGDPLYTIGLTRASLLNLGYDTDYTDHWLKLLNASEQQCRAVEFYTGLFLVVFLAEHGQQFNSDSPVAVDPKIIGKLCALIEQQLQAIR